MILLKSSIVAVGSVLISKSRNNMTKQKENKLISKIIKLLTGFSITEARTLLMSVERKIEEKQKIVIS
jgi:hypothetical protein